MQQVASIQALEEFHGGVFVPTMGALHEGHAALMRQARAAAGSDQHVVVSIFVNPTQFAAGEDLSKYPRTLEADLELCGNCGADIVFTPNVETIYPPGQNIEVPPLPAVATEPKLEDAHRPSHFRGVCQVVARLFDLVRPTAAVFGEKDYQQLLVIKAMVEQQRPRWADLEIIALPTVREGDGLGLSSRNRFLNSQQRTRALGISRALDAAGGAAAGNDLLRGDPSMVERTMRELLLARGLEVDYAVVRDATTLMPIESFDRPARALVAARVGSVRLIDNMALQVR